MIGFICFVRIIEINRLLSASGNPQPRSWRNVTFCREYPFATSTPINKKSLIRYKKMLDEQSAHEQ